MIRVILLDIGIAFISFFVLSTTVKLVFQNFVHKRKFANELVKYEVLTEQSKNQLLISQYVSTILALLFILAIDAIMIYFAFPSGIYVAVISLIVGLWYLKPDIDYKNLRNVKKFCITHGVALNEDKLNIFLLKNYSCSIEDLFGRDVNHK